MESRRFLNDAQPRPLFYAQFALYAGCVYPMLQGIVTGRWTFLLLLLAMLDGMAAYGLSNEATWGYWLGVVVSAGTLVHVLYDIVRVPALALHPDVWVLLALPIAVISWLTHPSSRDFARIWFD